MVFGRENSNPSVEYSNIGLTNICRINEIKPKIENKITIITGFEFCADVRVRAKIGAFKKACETAKSGLKSGLSSAFSFLSKGADSEIAIDGCPHGEIKTLLAELKKCGASVSERLGGNPAIEAAQFLSLGADVSYAGNFFQKYAARFSGGLSGELFFENADFGLSEKSKLRPVSIVLEANDARAILCSGEGRRIKHIREYLRRFPKLLKNAKLRREFDAISIPDLHVIFNGPANGAAAGIAKKDAALMARVLKKAKNSAGSAGNAALLFTDTGSFFGLDSESRQRLWELYGLFDVIGMNMQEFADIANIVNIAGIANIAKSNAAAGSSAIIGGNAIIRGDAINSGDSSRNGMRAKQMASKIPETMRAILEKTGAQTHTLWLHSHDFQATVSKAFSKPAIEKAQKISAACGALHVEGAQYPGESAIARKITNAPRNNGAEKSAAFKSAKSGNSVFVSSPCFNVGKPRFEAGAGDAASAAYLWSIISSQKSAIPRGGGANVW